MSDEIERILNRGVVEINVRTVLEKKLRAGKKLLVKFGIDPTGSDLHLGHIVPLKKLAEFQQLGHQIVLLFGSFTGKIGDPTGKDKMRQPLSDAEIRNNMKHYLKQAAKVIDIKQTEVVKNGDWLKKMDFEAVLRLAGVFTASQMMQRDMFQERLKKGLDINLVEFFYPLMQGYDSVAVRADVEIGGNDQLFNLMAGRRIQEAYGMPAQDIITVPMLEGLSGTDKMSKSLNNYIGVLDTPKEVFGKTMSIPDHLMAKYFELLTDLDRGEIGTILAGHPRDAKLRLAQELTTMLHDANAAQKAREEFLKIFADKGLPDDIAELVLPEGTYHLLDIVTRTGLCASASDARRQITGGAVKLDERRLTNLNEPVTVNEHAKILQIGKRRFCRLVAGS